MLIFCDTETSGLPNFKLPADDPSQPRMCSIAAVLTDDDGAEVNRLHHLIRPDGWTVPPETAAIHGLTTERLMADGIPVADALAGFTMLHDQASQILAFGIEFDLKILRGELRRIGLPDHYGEKPKTCVMRMATAACKIPPTNAMMATGRKSFKTPKLSEAVEILLGEKMEGARDALVDIQYTIRVWRRLRELQPAA